MGKMLKIEEVLSRNGISATAVEDSLEMRVGDHLITIVPRGKGLLRYTLERLPEPK